ncbi:MAG: TIGR00730 family Rossman fold protein [Kofleriaceae bacterium]|nr:TIGR00730 family Rossman fold protein [Kofleriaceae bacterium]
MRAVCVFLSSTVGSPVARAVIHELGTELARRDLTLVYGGASIGLMGVLADAVLAAGGRVYGVIPEALQQRELAHPGLTELFIVDNMHARKAKMFDLADAFIVAPGGFGTLEEAFEILTGQQIGVHHKPTVFLDIENFWAGLDSFLQHAAQVQVLRAEVYSLFVRADSPTAALDFVAVPAAVRSFSL